MRIGGSRRRRRDASRPRRNQQERRWALRPHPGSLLAAGLALFGLGSGYLYATQVLYPAPERVAEFVPVPDVQAMTPADAEETLLSSNLRLGAVDSIRHPEIPAGEIVGQSPLPSQLSVPDGEVRVTLSLGPETRPVPDVLRLRADRAATVLQASGFTVVVDSVEADLPQGRIVSVEPAVGTSATLPAEVLLEVSLGPPLVELPDLRGLREAEAGSVLDSLGLVVGEVETRFRFGTDLGEVLEQEPEPGEMVERGTAVRLVVGGSGALRQGPQASRPRGGG